MLKPVAEVMLVVAAALIRGDGRVLVQQRPAGKPMAGLWEFPGGKVEPGETPEAALIRELAEELGVAFGTESLTPIAFASEAQGARHLVLLLYGLERWEGVPEPHHASALRWATVEEMRALPMPPADVPLVEVLAGLLKSSPGGGGGPAKLVEGD